MLSGYGVTKCKQRHVQLFCDFVALGVYPTFSVVNFGLSEFDCEFCCCQDQGK